MKEIIEILYQDNYLVAVNKRAGLFVHPQRSGDDLNISLLHILRDQTGLFLYPIHRIDRPASGIVLFALSSEMARLVQEAWHRETTEKKYLALVRGKLQESGTYDGDLISDKGVLQNATTYFRPLKCFTRYTYVEVTIATGRKHQIRRHFKRACHNLVGDRMYGKGETNNYFLQHFGLQQLFLHAHQLSLIHPYTGETVHINAPLPIQLENVIHQLELISQI